MFGVQFRTLFDAFCYSVSIDRIADVGRSSSKDPTLNTLNLYPAAQPAFFQCKRGRCIDCIDLGHENCAHAQRDTGLHARGANGGSGSRPRHAPVHLGSVWGPNSHAV